VQHDPDGQRAQVDVMLETSMQKPIHEAIVKRLEDKSIEVQTVAVKWCVRARRPAGRLQATAPAQPGHCCEEGRLHASGGDGRRAGRTASEGEPR
jgi:hypothetical protein